MSRVYKVTEEGLASYMKHNYMSETAVIGETSDGFILQNGRKIKPLSKHAVESWMLDHGHVPNMGYDAMSERDRAIFHQNRTTNSTVKAEEKAYQATTKDSNLQAFHDTQKSTRQANARADAHQPIVQPWKGSKSYTGSGTNQ